MMSKTAIRWIISLLAISLVGIVAFQVYWLRTAVQIRQDRFNQNVALALDQMAEKIRSKDVVSFLGDSSGGVIIRGTETPVRDGGDVGKGAPALPLPCVPGHPEDVDSGQVQTLTILDSVSTIMVRYDDTTADEQGGPPKNLLSGLGQLADLQMFSNLRLPDMSVVLDSFFEACQHPNSPRLTDSAGHTMYVNHGVRIVIYPDSTVQKSDPAKIRAATREKGRQFQQAIKQMVVEYTTLDKPLAQRLNNAWVDSVLRAGFRDRGIPIPFEYAVLSGKNDSIAPLRSPGFDPRLKARAFRHHPLPPHVFVEPDYLLVYFPDRTMHIYKSMGLAFAGSILLVLLVIAALGASVSAILKQKRMSDIKTDFINNMTHEFKTPIATISLAADAIDNPRVLDDPDQIRYFSRIIREENRRMNHQVENILQMALLDREVFGLQLLARDVHDILLEAADRIRLQVENRKGVLTCRLMVDRPVAEVDGPQLLAVFLNILDNALKYSPGIPNIQVETRTEGSHLVIAISDQGLGMSREQQKHIFEKFFRASTGNVHNVKGFGLGLSFAKAIMLLHHGDIRVRSELGQGSTFELRLPLIPEINDHGQDPSGRG